MPAQIDWFLDKNSNSKEAWQRAIAVFEERTGLTQVEIDLAPFLGVADLLYNGPFLCERWLGIEDTLRSQSKGKAPFALHPAVKTIIQDADSRFTGVQAFQSIYKLQELASQCQNELSTKNCLFLVTPTVAATYTIAEMEADPIRLNANLGRYTNWMNLLDMCGISVPCEDVCWTKTVGSKETLRLPFSLTIAGPAGEEESLLRLAESFGTTPDKAVPDRALSTFEKVMLSLTPHRFT